MSGSISSEPASIDSVLPASSGMSSSAPSYGAVGAPTTPWGAPDGAAQELPPGPYSSMGPMAPTTLGYETPATGAARRSSVDELLPPGASSTPMQPSGNAPIPMGGGAGGVVAKVATDTVVIPTEEGSYVAVRAKEKTIRFKGEEVEVRRLSPEEKARKRFVKNIIMGIFGILTLVTLAILLMMMN
jgi:hypothetical protein